MQGNDYLLNALLFGGEETVDLRLQRNSFEGVSDWPVHFLLYHY